MMRIVARLVMGLFFVTLLAFNSITSWASNASDANTIVVKVKLTAEGFDLDPNIYPSWRELLKDAKPILIIPQIIKGGFIFEGSGSGVLLARNKLVGWNGPTSYTIGGISFGLLAGAQVADTIIVVRTERGLNRLLNTSVKLGTDVSVAAGPVGSGIGSTNIIADLVFLSRSKGLYRGLLLHGSVVSGRRGTLDRA
jgi:lipid-binding SYLF domain-containing protein